MARQAKKTVSYETKDDLMKRTKPQLIDLCKKHGVECKISQLKENLVNSLLRKVPKENVQAKSKAKTVKKGKTTKSKPTTKKVTPKAAQKKVIKPKTSPGKLIFEGITREELNKFTQKELKEECVKLNISECLESGYKKKDLLIDLILAEKSNERLKSSLKRKMHEPKSVQRKKIVFDDPEKSDLEKLTVPQLKEKCKKLGITGCYGLKKDIIGKIVEKEAEEEEEIPLKVKGRVPTREKKAPTKRKPAVPKRKVTIVESTPSKRKTNIPVTIVGPTPSIKKKPTAPKRKPAVPKRKTAIKKDPEREKLESEKVVSLRKLCKDLDIEPCKKGEYINKNTLINLILNKQKKGKPLPKIPTKKKPLPKIPKRKKSILQLPRKFSGEDRIEVLSNQYYDEFFFEDMKKDELRDKYFSISGEYPAQGMKKKEIIKQLVFFKDRDLPGTMDKKERLNYYLGLNKERLEYLLESSGVKINIDLHREVLALYTYKYFLLFPNKCREEMCSEDEFCDLKYSKCVTKEELDEYPKGYVYDKNRGIVGYKDQMNVFYDSLGIEKDFEEVRKEDLSEEESDSDATEEIEEEEETDEESDTDTAEEFEEEKYADLSIDDVFNPEFDVGVLQKINNLSSLEKLCNKLNIGEKCKSGEKDKLIKSIIEKRENFLILFLEEDLGKSMTFEKKEKFLQDNYSENFLKKYSNMKGIPFRNKSDVKNIIYYFENPEKAPTKVKPLIEEEEELEVEDEVEEKLEEDEETEEEELEEDEEEEEQVDIDIPQKLEGIEKVPKTEIIEKKIESPKRHEVPSDLRKEREDLAQAFATCIANL